ncbi:hypothetical protein AB0M39_20775 [Streptomyces sp. NPDC051907]|uniref:hypothetical protein n=1 Tax=Streptomyces sp. NPDC051907 TaxID=3155284 RepID=UPI0034331C5E
MSDNWTDPTGPDEAGEHGEAGAFAYEDILAVADFFAGDAAVPRGGELVRDRVGGASLGSPLVYDLPAGSGDGVVEAERAQRDVLVCFPFDLERLPGGRGYHEVTLTVALDPGPRALALHPAPGTTAADGAEVAAFGLGKDRLQWVFRAPGRGGALRPDGRWAQAVVRLPAAATELTGRLRLSAVTVQPMLGGAFRRREAETSHDTPFRLSTADLWSAGAPLARDETVPGAWALSAFEEAFSASRDELPPGRRRLCLAVDIEKYSARDNADMVRLQRALLRTLHTACAQARIAWQSCGRQAQGDGYLLVFEPGIDETRVVPGLLRGLGEGLATANAALPEAERAPGADGPAEPAGQRTRSIRMRASLHQGIVHEADSGYAGSAVVTLFRNLDSGPLRGALADDPSAHLAVAFSDTLYEDLVATGYDGLTATGFRRTEVHIESKDFRSVAWIRALRA